MQMQSYPCPRLLLSSPLVPPHCTRNPHHSQSLQTPGAAKTISNPFSKWTDDKTDRTSTGRPGWTEPCMSKTARHKVNKVSHWLRLTVRTSWTRTRPALPSGPQEHSLAPWWTSGINPVILSTHLPDTDENWNHKNESTLGLEEIKVFYDEGELFVAKSTSGTTLRKFTLR